MSVQPQPAAGRRLLSKDAPPASFSDALSGRDVRHAFFGRDGGVSQGIYASLNAGTGSNDDAKAVAENRHRIARAFRFEPRQLVGVHQVHSPTAVSVSEPWPGERPHADALVTTMPGVALSILTADCTPVLLADTDAGVIAAAHAGWKGALGGVLESAVRAMMQHGAQPERIVAAIGPCIHAPSYEVGPEFKARFVETDAAFASFFAPGQGDRMHFDLPGFCAERLQRLGVVSIETLPLDTYPEASRFHSHRRSVHQKAGDYGRNCAAIALS